MNLDDKLRQKARQEDIPVPEDFTRRVEETLSRLPARRSRPHIWRRYLGSVSAAVVVLAFLLPNSSAAMADTMASLPLVGPLFQVITVRTYEQEDGKNHVSIDTPQISQEETSPGAQEINDEIDAYVEKLIADYEQTAHSDGYYNLDVTWEVVTNTQRWFTLCINSDLIMASGNHQARYYHIDVPSGQQKRLSDLFPEDYDYVTAISDELKNQLRQRMAEDDSQYYWLEESSQLGTYYFDAIDPNQDFYFDDQGQIVIPFDKYEVAPGSTGSPSFTLTTPELYENLLYHP